VLEAVEQLASIIHLQHYTTFTLFECRKLMDRPTSEQVPDEHVLLDDHKYIADVLYEIRTSATHQRGTKEPYSSRLLFKKRMFRETDETVTETVFVNLSYVQAQFDYLQGNYPVVRDDAAQMCALQIQAESGPTLIDQEEAVMECIEKYITKSVLMTRPRDEWLLDVTGRYRALEQFSNEEARLQFLRILRSLPYGNSIFFSVKRIEDPIGLLPAKLILGINKRGVHFFRPVPKEYLHSAELRDIMQFGSSTQAVFFKMRVAGVLHIFQFETRQGEDICTALQTHINDIMMKRYSKAKQTSNGDRSLPQANFGPKYEQHVSSIQKSLEEVKAQLTEKDTELSQLSYERDALKDELMEAQQQLTFEKEEKAVAIAQVRGFSFVCMEFMHVFCVVLCGTPAGCVAASRSASRM
jgi:hypothetical protein